MHPPPPDEMLAPVQRTSLSEQVFEQLRDQIVSGARAPGEPLPSERVLAEHLGINRGAVREALKQLEQARLIAVRQGDASRVLDYRETAGIELLGALVLDGDGNVNGDVVRSIMEMRSALAPALAGAAATRSGAALRAPLDAALVVLASAADNTARAKASRAFWALLVDGSQNIAYRLAYNSLNETTARLDGVLGDVMAAEFGDREGYRRLADAVMTGGAAAASKRALALVRQGEAAIAALVDVLESQGGTS